MRCNNPLSIAAWLLCLGMAATPAVAEEAGAAPPAPAVSAFGEQLSDADLSTYRGGSALQINEMMLDSKLLNNSAYNNVTGSNFVGQEAFNGSSGFSTVVQNSGNNVIIQNATILNISLH